MPGNLGSGLRRNDVHELVASLETVVPAQAGTQVRARTTRQKRERPPQGGRSNHPCKQAYIFFAAHILATYSSCVGITPTHLAITPRTPSRYSRISSSDWVSTSGW